MRGFLLAVWIGSVFFATSAGAVNRTESAFKKRNVAAADTSVVASAQQQAPAGRSGAAADSRPVPPETLSVLSEETGVTSGAVPVVTKELSVSKPDSMQGKTHAPADSMEMAVDSMSGDSTVKKGFFHRFYNYFKSANVDKTLTKKFDFSIIGGPHYSSDIKLGLGLVAAGLHQNPVPYADVVTTTTHKTLRGPRGGMILCKEELAKKIDSAIFPGTQGGPLEHIIASKAVCFGEALKPEFKTYARNIVTNAKALADGLQSRGVKLVSGGTDNHMMLIDLSDLECTGKELEHNLDEVHITANKNSVPGEKRSPFITSGLRVGTPAVTTRGFGVAEMDVIAGCIADCIFDFEGKKADVAARVEELVRRFPLYE